MRNAFLAGIRREVAYLLHSGWDLALLTWIPLLLLGVVAVEMSSGVMRKLPIAVFDSAGGAISRELIRRLDASPGLHVVARPMDMKKAEHLARSREVYAFVFIPKEIERNVLRGTTGSVTLFYNASYSTPSGVVVRDIGTVVQAYAESLAIRQSAAIVGPTRIRRPPVTAQSTILFNPQASYELQLVALLHPALLHLIFMVAIAGALGRELRDGTIGAWLTGPREEAVAAVAGKLLPYLVVFMIWGLLATGYLAGLRGWPIAGSLTVLMIGYLAMYLAYIGVTILLVGLTLSMGQSLSMSGLYAGASFAFAGAIFPLESASAFARVWSALLPYSTFAKILAEQWIMAAPVLQSLRLAILLLVFLAVGAAVGLPRYIAAAAKPETWGKR